MSDNKVSLVQRRHKTVNLPTLIPADNKKSEVVYNANSVIQQGMKRRAQTGFGQVIQNQFFSPFRIRPSLETPTKRVDLNEWYRYYFKHDPYVGTSIELHATYPLSDFEVEHENKGLAEEFNNVNEELGLDSFLRRMAIEYWIVGEAFPFGFLDDVNDPSMFERFILLDPDKIKINKHPMAVGKHNRDYFIRLEPDADLKKIINNGPNHPNTGDLFRNIPADVIDNVRRNKNIELHPLQVSHFKREVNAFNVRGESIISRVLQDLMYMDKIRDGQYAIADRHICYDKETECLTKDGWKKYNELGWDDLIGTVNKDTGALEWANPTGFYINNYKGKMIHFGGEEKDKKIDIKVTPDHRMLVQKYKYQGSSGYKKHLKRCLGNYGYDGEWEVVKSQDVPAKAKFRACVDEYEGDECPDHIMIADTKYDIDNYLKMVGWYLSEGHWNKISDNSFEVSSSQTERSQHSQEFDEVFDACGFRRHVNNQGTIIRAKSGKEIALHFSINYGVRSWDKKIPTWVRSLPREKLKILLDAMVKGDGTTTTESAYKGKKYDHKYVRYYSVSKELADNVQDIAFKLGYAPTITKDSKLKKKAKLLGYSVKWSETTDNGKFPYVGHTKKEVYTEEDYDDVIWCVMVPNTFFVTRRNGKVAVQGNTPREFYFIGEPGDPADEAELQDFHNALANTYHGYNTAIVWHHAVKLQWEGAQGKVLPLKAEYDMLEKRLLAGLMMSSAWLHGEGPNFANASVAMDVLIARYREFRERLEHWLVHHVYDPICRMNNIYKPTDAEVHHRIRVKDKKKKPWVPKIRWERGALRDDQFKIQLFERLVEKQLIPRDMLYKSININPKQVNQDMKNQSEQDAEAREKGEPIPGQPQPAGRGLPGGLPGGPPGGGGGGGPGSGLPQGGLPPGAPKLPTPGTGLPQGTPVPAGSGLGPANAAPGDMGGE